MDINLFGQGLSTRGGLDQSDDDARDSLSGLIYENLQAIMQNDIEELKRDNDRVTSENASLLTENASLRTENASLRTERESGENEVRALRRDIDRVTVQNDTLREDLVSGNNEVRTLTDENAALRSTVASLGHGIHSSIDRSHESMMRELHDKETRNAQLREVLRLHDNNLQQMTMEVGRRTVDAYFSRANVDPVTIPTGGSDDGNGDPQTAAAASGILGLRGHPHHDHHDAGADADVEAARRGRGRGRACVRATVPSSSMATPSPSPMPMSAPASCVAYEETRRPILMLRLRITGLAVEDLDLRIVHKEVVTDGCFLNVDTPKRNFEYSKVVALTNDENNRAYSGRLYIRDPDAREDDIHQTTLAVYSAQIHRGGQKTTYPESGMHDEAGIPFGKVKVSMREFRKRKIEDEVHFSIDRHSVHVSKQVLESLSEDARLALDRVPLL